MKEDAESAANLAPTKAAGTVPTATTAAAVPLINNDPPTSFGTAVPHEVVKLSNMGMMGFKQFDAVINPPQGMILAIGAGEKRPYIVDDAIAIATVMSATRSFDHGAIDGADGAMLMKVCSKSWRRSLWGWLRRNGSIMLIVWRRCRKLKAMTNIQMI